MHPHFMVMPLLCGQIIEILVKKWPFDPCVLKGPLIDLRPHTLGRRSQADVHDMLYERIIITRRSPIPCGSRPSQIPFSQICVQGQHIDTFRFAI